MSQIYQDPFVTVVSVGIEDKTQQCTPKKAVNNSEYITVLTIGNEETKTIKDVTEEVIVYRLPGERLGFGLKFEGGTKAHEFVKRLFIQSCAPDSPASRVQSSWGQLVEGDEVLEIDSIAVSSMTRIDCVRFLKDSNVAIKLLVKHCFNTVHPKTRSSEDLPVIVSTEEKKPPPVPPRKIHRKLQKHLQNNNDENIVPTIKQLESFSCKSTRLQSPRNSFRKKYSPDVSRRLSDGSLGPPDAEVYLDLISQESTLSLSESDDTGSTISTVLDRFASFPTTTTSSFAGSLPSTPTSVQKQLDLSYLINEFPDDDFMPIIDKFNRIEENNNLIDGTDEDNIKCHQEVKSSDQTDSFNVDNNDISCQESSKRPVIIPRSRDKISKNNSSNDSLPRLVDFVPKSPQKEVDASMDTLKRFLDSERFDFEYTEHDSIQEDDLDYNMDAYSSKWILSSHLSTIGEDEEEQSIQDASSNFESPYFTPRVTIEASETSNSEISQHSDSALDKFEAQKDKQISMEIPPSDSRQPPDGHEFPDFVEATGYSTSSYTPILEECDRNFKSTWSQPVIKHLDRSMSSSNYDLRPNMHDSDEEKYEPAEKSNLLHTRSQSLVDMSIFSKEKSSSKWNTLMEQRKNRLSKLKGLVIPEAAENDVTPLLNIPEIKSITTSQIDLVSPKIENSINLSPKREVTAPIILPSWSSNTSLPKYSPAFKRKGLQVYPVSTVKKSDSSDAESSYDEYISKYSDNTPSRSNSDDPKSLESIASPTRSDYSFDYSSLKTSTRDHHFNNTKDFADSDNDSAVSSSQSSYNSRSSPPPSPTSEDKNGQNRMLKPSSVEAQNRKNILASAKCRSGKDLKIGSPVIQRKSSLEEKTERPRVEEAVPNNTKHEHNNVAQESRNSPEATYPDEHVDTVLSECHKSHSSEETEEPVIFEVGVERAITQTTNLTEKNEEKPTPTKRTNVPVPTVRESKPKIETESSSFDALTKRHSISSILDKRNKPVNVRSLKANFENPSTQSLPVFPKNYKADSKNVSPAELSKPLITTRRRSEEFHIAARRKSDDKLLFRQISQEEEEEKPKIEIRRSSNISKTTSTSSTTNGGVPLEEHQVRNVIRNVAKKEEVVVRTPNKENLRPTSIELRTVELSLNQSGTSLGITLAGGVDYENKNITIHRIRYGSIAYQDGHLKKGDKVVSINGHATTGMTHSDATELLKIPSTKFVIVIEESRDFVPSSNLSRKISSSISSLASETKGNETDTLTSPIAGKKPTHTIKIVKDGGGLGFSIEGGKDSPKGDVPLVVKKIFAGGAADKCGELKSGDEIISVNKINFQNLSRIEAWSQMKKIPEGEVTIEIFR